MLVTLWKKILSEKNHEQLFTDGFVGNVGCAFYHKNRNINKTSKLNSYPCVYTVELTAISFCLSLVIKNFVIFTDSKSSLEKKSEP